MTRRPVLLWLRQDLRLRDHPALDAALAVGAPVIPVYVLDDESPGQWALGAASRWWLHESLAALDKALRKKGSRLVLRRGPAPVALARLAEESGAQAIYWSRAFEPWAVKLEQTLYSTLEKAGVRCRRFSGRLLFEPEEVRTAAGGSYKVFTPFSSACLELPGPGTPHGTPAALPPVSKGLTSERLEDWALQPANPDWAGGLREAWTPGEAGARTRLRRFVEDALGNYHTRRDRPDMEGTSRLSPHLHFGEISPRQCWQAVQARAGRRGSKTHEGAMAFQRELLWRDFSCHLLYHFPGLPERPLRQEFEHFPWEADQRLLAAWQKGRTGYPIVDAGMRELWATGWMHNRVRMVAASFLVKHLLQPWQAGEAWFRDTLVDADLANNAANWQWVAGCGADAAPWFRIFNPVLQGRKFDPRGNYVRRWVPELAGLGPSVIHAPWEASPRTLEKAGIMPGETYPEPVVDHRTARERALAAYAEIRRGKG